MAPLTSQLRTTAPENSHRAPLVPAINVLGSQNVDIVDGALVEEVTKWSPSESNWKGKGAKEVAKSF